MRLEITRDVRTPGAQRLLEIITPGSNESGIEATQNMLAAGGVREPFALEIAGTSDVRWFSLRTGSEAGYQYLRDCLGVAYSQGKWREVNTADNPTADPAFVATGQQLVAYRLDLRDPEYLPLRTFTDEVLGEAPGQSDPILTILAALGRVPPGWRALSQLLLLPEADDWGRRHERLLEKPAPEQRNKAEKPSLLPLFITLGALMAVSLGIRVHGWYLDGDWLPLGLTGATGLGGVSALAGVMRHLAGKGPVDPELVRLKICELGYRAQLRLAVIAPESEDKQRLAGFLNQFAGAYRQYSLPLGNANVTRELGGVDLRFLEPFGSAATLNVQEIASLWHLPRTEAEAPLLERTTYRRVLPLPDQVRTGRRIGVSEHLDRQLPVHLPLELLLQHLLLVAQTRFGKSSLLQQFIWYLARELPASRGALLLVDPHSDLAQAALGLLPFERRRDLVYLDVADPTYRFGLNLLDVALAWNPDQAANSVVSIMHKQWDANWGPRMENTLRYAVMALHESNQIMCAADPQARTRQYTLLDVIPFLTDVPFRRHVVDGIKDVFVRRYWLHEFDASFDRRTQVDTISPILTKLGRFASSPAARTIIGQPCSTIDPAAWLRDGSIVVVDTAKTQVGEGTSALIGATLINLMAAVVVRQGELRPDDRRRLAVFVDEFHNLPGADYEAILSELPKMGVSLCLATQSLARLDALHRLSGRSLKEEVFANISGLFAFKVSANDAEELVPELGGRLTKDDLIFLPRHRCYARLAPPPDSDVDPQPAFLVTLDPPPKPDARLRRMLAERSAALYGRHRDTVEEALQSSLTRVEQARNRWYQEVSGGNTGLPKDMPGKTKNSRKQRSERRNRREPPEPHQASMFNPDDGSHADVEPPAGDPAPESGAETDERGDDAGE